MRVAPGEDLPAFVEMLRKVANEPGVEIIPPQRLSRVVAPPSRIDTGRFRAIEAAQRKIYPGAITIPTMSTGAADKVFLQAKGVTTYGFGPVVDEEDAEKGFGAHSDQERLRETELYRFARFNWSSCGRSQPTEKKSIHRKKAWVVAGTESYQGAGRTSPLRS